MDAVTRRSLTSRSAVELAAMITRGDAPSAEVVEAHIERIEQVNPAVNAVVVKLYDQARAEAEKADRRRAKGEQLGALHGVPITIKDAIDVVGTPSTFGLRSRTHILPKRDDAYVARMRAAGAIILEGVLSGADGRLSSVYHRDDGRLSSGILFERVSERKRPDQALPQRGQRADGGAI